MAAYAALVSVMHIIETIQNHPRPPISFDKDQLQSLTQNISFLQEFLETQSVDDDDLESRIADAAYAAEDVIESYIVDQIEANIIDHGETISSSDSEDFLETHSVDDDELESRILSIRNLFQEFHAVISSDSEVETTSSPDSEEFLETHSVDDDGLESRIADAAYAAEENVIESHIVDQIQANIIDHGETISSSDSDGGTISSSDSEEFLETHSIDDEGLESRIADASYAAEEDVIESHTVDRIQANIIDHGETDSKDDEGLESRIADAAYAAEENVIESHIVDQIQANIIDHGETISSSYSEEFLETHSIDDEGLESRIADAAYAAEDVIESHIVDQTEASKTISFSDFYDGLHKVIQDLDLIQRDMPSFAKKAGIKEDDDDQLLHNNYSLRRSHSSMVQDTSVGLDDVVVEVMNKLTWNQSNRQIIPIFGMGGIGKTTLASNIYVNPVIVQYFDFRGWATISQEYNSKEILLEVLLCINMGSRESLSEMSEEELGDKLYKSLFGRRYLIVLDDIWSIEAWDKVKTFFPNENGNDGSAILLTTRLSNLASQLSDSCYEMSFLDDDKSWNLFCKSTFGEESCPRELEDIGKEIVENCKGLPLSIVVVGGLLAKSKRTREYWLYIAKNLNSIVNLENNERCLKILHLSYKELSVHLKPCFLYMGVYPENTVIDVPELMRLWVAEGFLKPISGKFLEEVAKEYFDELVGRNLILVNKRAYSGETMKCKVHDLLVDVCFREAQKHKFICVARHHNFSNSHDLNTERRIVVHDSTIPREVIRAWLSHHATLVRSLTINYSCSFPKLFNSKLLRVLRVFNSRDVPVLKSFHRIVNCRYISGAKMPSPNSPNPNLLSSNPTPLYSFRLLWNLQTLYVNSSNLGEEVAASDEIWKMSQLRHVCVGGLYLLDPPPSGHMDDEGDDIVLGNLQTLKWVKNFKFSVDVVKRIPNLKELEVTYTKIVNWSSCCLNNLVQLINLESLSFYSFETIPSKLLENLSFPRSLKELSLYGTRLDWRDMGTKIGLLPHLQVLKLRYDSFVGPKWETDEGQFRSLKYLKMDSLYGLKYWRTESCTHFPCLERLYIRKLPKLKEIPSEIGETLKSIEMNYCSDSTIISAEEILKEQEGLGNRGLQVISFSSATELLRNVSLSVSATRQLILLCEWETVEGQFRSLKYLEMALRDLKYWRTKSLTHPLSMP